MERLRIERARQHLTLEQLSVKSGVGMVTISEIERDKRKPHPGTLAKLSEALGIPVEELTARPLPGADEAPPDLPESTAPKAGAPPLNELLEAAGCKTRWLALSDEEWHEAYEALTPEEKQQRAIQIGREVQDEYVAVRPDLIDGMKAEQILYPYTPWFRCPFGSVWIQIGRRYREAYKAARKALEGTEDPTDSGRFPPLTTLGAPEPIPEDEVRYVLWAGVEETLPEPVPIG